MKEITLIFNKHPKKIKLVNIPINNRNIKFRVLELSDTSLTLETINKIEFFLKSIKNFPSICINLKSIKLSQKLPISILEWLCYDLITKKHKNVVLEYNAESDIFTESFKSSPLIFLGRNKKYNSKTFVKKFEFSSSRNEKEGISHYRRLISPSKGIEYLSALNSDIFDTFPSFVQKDTKDQVTQLITEIVGNALEHPEADCVMDLDITSNNYTYDKNRVEKQGKRYFGINVSVFNHSEMLLFSEIKKKILHDLKKIDGRNTGRYNFISTAYANQKESFDATYSEDNFWTLASIQHKISGRPFSGTGGTGLTTLVNALQQASELDRCYILTGNDILLLKKKYLNHTKNMWLGFNQSNDFNKTPDKLIFKKSPLTFNGTAFNLSFIMEG